MTTEAPKSAPQRADRQRRDWVPMGLTLCVWVCTLPFMFLLVVPWLGARAAVGMALALLAVLAVACWALCSASRAPRGPSASKAES